jgi:hypothetical protein
MGVPIGGRTGQLLSVGMDGAVALYAGGSSVMGMQSGCLVPISVKNFFGTPSVVCWRCNMGVPDEKQPVPINDKNGFWDALGSALAKQYGLCGRMDGAVALYGVYSVMLVFSTYKCQKWFLGRPR